MLEKASSVHDTDCEEAGLDASNVSTSYRPTSNLSLLSTLLCRLVMRQLSSADLLPSLQSGFRSSHSTETAVLRVLSDILRQSTVAVWLLRYNRHQHLLPATAVMIDSVPIFPVTYLRP